MDTWVSSGRGRSLCDSDLMAIQRHSSLASALSLQLVSESPPPPPHTLTLPAPHPHSLLVHIPSLSPRPPTVTPSLFLHPHTITYSHMSHLHFLPIPTLSWLQLGGLVVPNKRVRDCKCISVESRDYCNNIHSQTKIVLAVPSTKRTPSSPRLEGSLPHIPVTSCAHTVLMK